MDSKDSQLLDLAREMCDLAHAPYSRFQVGVALATSVGVSSDDSQSGDGIFVGCNVENASSGLTICGERVAVSSWVAAGRPGSIETIAIAARRQDGSWADGRPCGACRQVLQELSDSPESLRVLLWTSGGVVESSLSQLLPDPFRPEDLRGGE